MGFLNLAKKDDSKDYLNDDVILDIKDQKGIYKKRQENQKKQNLYSVSKESNEIDTEIYLDNLENESKKLDAETSVIKLRIKNAKNNNLLGRVNRALDMNGMINENKKKDIDKVKKRGKKFNRSSTALSIISALTTVVGLGIENYNKISNLIIFTLVQLFITIAIIYASLKINDQVKTLTDFSDKFYQKKNRKKTVILFGKMFMISAYTAFSIKTNVTFWGQFFDTARTWLFSILFDGLSIITAVESDTCLNLDFNKKYKDEINEVFDDFEENDNKNASTNDNNYPFDDSNRKDDDSKNGKKNN